MANRKTTPHAPPPPRHHAGFIRKCDEDDYLGRHLPVPTRIVSNEEYDPPAQTPAQRRVENLLLETAGALFRLALPVMDQVKHEAQRRKVELVIVPTARAIELLKGQPPDTNAILHVTC